MEPLKEMFNAKYYQTFTRVLKMHYPSCNEKVFLDHCLEDLKSRELNQRLRRTSEALNLVLPSDLKVAVPILKKVIRDLPRGYTNLVFPDYVALYGLRDIKFSLESLKYFTSYGSSEFAIRVFLKLDFDLTIAEMKKWSKDANEHVRRLSSEGSRPRLPWSFKLDRVIADPSQTIQILENLKEDESLYVRKSVANHLNDISKDHPEFFLEVLKNWGTTNVKTSWILKHAGRTLLKKGNVRALSAFGIKHSEGLKLKEFQLKKKKIKIGDDLLMNFQVQNTQLKSIPLRLEYALYFNTSSGSLSKKVFKISEKTVAAKQNISIEKKHSFKVISTRKYYSGLHQVAVVVNGKEYPAEKFVLH